VNNIYYAMPAHQEYIKVGNIIYYAYCYRIIKVEGPEVTVISVAEGLTFSNQSYISAKIPPFKCDDCPAKFQCMAGDKVDMNLLLAR
jgi:hypothetical protein